MPEETKTPEQDFFDALDKTGGTTFTDEPVPEATYMFKLTHIGGFKCTSSGDYQISLGITVINDEDGYDRDDYDRDGYYRDGYDEDGYDKEGYDEDGYDEDGYDSHCCGATDDYAYGDNYNQ